MSFYKIDLQEDAWLDQVFLSRNQSYGAFLIRKSYSQSSLYGFGIALSSFILLMTIPLIMNAFNKRDLGSYVLSDPTVLTLPPPLIHEAKPKPIVIPKSMVKPITRASITMTPPKIEPDDRVDNKSIPPSVEETKGKNMGSTTTQREDGPIDIPSDEQGKEILGEKTDAPFVTVEQPATYPGGFGALSAEVSKYLKNHYPLEAIEKGYGGKVFLNFVVERDGSISAIKIIGGKDIGGGLPELAIEAVEHLQKFNPGRQNGRFVRQYFNFPIHFQVGGLDN